MNDYHDRKSFNLHVLRSKIVNWKQGHEDNEHSQRAVDFLIKKLKNSDGKLIFILSFLIYSLRCRCSRFISKSFIKSSFTKSMYNHSTIG